METTPPILPTLEHGTKTFETLPDTFGVFRCYNSYPTSVPDQDCSLPDYSNKDYETPGLGNSTSDADVKSIISPCPNMSTYLMQKWHWVDGARKTQQGRDDLVNEVLLDPHFSLDDIRGVNWSSLDDELEAKGSTGLSAGWKSATLGINVPAYTSSSSSHIEKFEIPDFQYRPLMDVVTEAFSHNDPKNFHYEPFELYHASLGSDTPQKLSQEIYNSKFMMDAHKEVNELPAEPGCTLPRAAAVLMVSSDGAQVAQFSTTNIHPVYVFFGNHSKYEHCKPSSNTCYDVAHIPPV